MTSPNQPGHDLTLGIDDHSRRQQCSPVGGSVISLPLENQDPRQGHADRFPLGGSAITVETAMTAGGASAASALGSNALGSNRNECPPAGHLKADARERRRVRFAARAVLWQASTFKCVRMCGRVIRQDSSHGSGTSGPGVTVKRSWDGSSAGYGNLLTCGSVWACPRCAAVIASTRSEELSNAIRAAHAGGANLLPVNADDATR